MKEPLHRQSAGIAPILLEVRFSDDQLRALGGYIAEAALTPQPPLPVPQAAKALGISKEALRQRVKAGTVARVVIPLHHCGGKLHDDSELRFALRSIEKHFKTEFEVVIVGRKLPAWLHGVRHIEQPKKGLKTALHMAAKSYPDGFFWFYDDTILVRDTTEVEMQITPACRSWSKPKTAWRKQLDSIRVRLQAEQLPAWDYSSPHGPYWFDLPMIEESFRDWPGMASKFPFESWILSKRDWPRSPLEGQSGARCDFRCRRSELGRIKKASELQRKFLDGSRRLDQDSSESMGPSCRGRAGIGRESLGSHARGNVARLPQLPPHRKPRVQKRQPLERAGGVRNSGRLRRRYSTRLSL